MALTYLEIVNNAMAETKVTLDQLTAGTFASPPRTVMYNNFKRWANDAYIELLQKRPEWEYRSERAAVEIWPRLHVSGLTYTPAPGDQLVGTSSGVVFTVKAVHTYEDVEQDATVERTLSVEFSSDSDPANIIIKEVLDRQLPTVASSVGFIKAVGRYNFKDEVVGLEEIDPDNLTLTYPPNDADEFGNEIHKLDFLPRSAWHPQYHEFPWTSGYSHPHFVTEEADGNYSLYPMPLRNYVLSFPFSRKTTPLVLSTDVPEALPERFHNYLVWKTVMEYADFNQDPALFMRAKKHVDEYLYWMDRDLLNKPSIGRSLFRV